MIALPLLALGDAVIIDSDMAFSEGFFARNDGQARDANPYRAGLKSWHAWHTGWDEAIATAHAIEAARFAEAGARQRLPSS